MKKIILIFTLLALFLGCKTTQTATKVIRPQQGTIIFERQTVFTDKTKYTNSVNAFCETFDDELKKWVLENEEVDEAILELHPEFFKNTLKQMFFNSRFSTEKWQYIHKFQDSLIVSFKKTANKVIGDYWVINRNKNIFHYLAKKDSTTTYYQNRPYPYREAKEFSLKEFRNDVKTINGFPCFKVVVTVQEDAGEDAPDALNKLTTVYTMYVTEHIQCAYHPVIRYRSVMEKYYPLEIIEKDVPIEGVEIRYDLAPINLDLK